MIFWVAAVFLLPVSPIWPPRRPFLPYGRPNLALAGILVSSVLAREWLGRSFRNDLFCVKCDVKPEHNQWSDLHAQLVNPRLTSDQLGTAELLLTLS